MSNIRRKSQSHVNTNLIEMRWKVKQGPSKLFTVWWLTTIQHMAKRMWPLQHVMLLYNLNNGSHSSVKAFNKIFGPGCRDLLPSSHMSVKKRQELMLGEPCVKGVECQGLWQASRDHPHHHQKHFLALSMGALTLKQELVLHFTTKTDAHYCWQSHIMEHYHFSSMGLRGQTLLPTC